MSIWVTGSLEVRNSSDELVFQVGDSAISDPSSHPMNLNNDVSIAGQLSIGKGITSNSAVRVSSTDSSTNSNPWIKIASSKGTLGIQNTTFASFLVVFEGGQHVTSWAGDFAYIVNVRFTYSNQSPYYYGAGTNITVEPLNTTSVAGFDPTTDVAITFDNTTVEVWAKSQTRYKECFVSYLGGTNSPQGLSHDAGFEILTGQSWSASIASLGQVVMGQYVDKVFNHTHVEGNLNVTGSIEMGSSAVANFGAGSTLNFGANSSISCAAFTIDSSADITLDSNVGQFYFKDGGSNRASIASNQFTIYHSSDTNDYFRIGVASNGATTIETVDNSNSAGAGLTIQPAGSLTLSPAGDVLITDTDSSQSSSPTLTLRTSDSGLNDGPVLRFDKTGAITQGENLGEIYFYGADDSANSNWRSAAFIGAEAAGDWNPGSTHPTDLKFSTTEGNTAPVDRMIISSSGDVSIVGGDLIINKVSTAATEATLQLRTYDTNISSGDNIGAIRFYGTENNSDYDEMAVILVEADENFEHSTKFGSRFKFGTATNTGTLSTKMELDNAGNLSIDGDLTVSGDDIKDSGDNTVLSFDGSGNIDTLLSLKSGIHPLISITNVSSTTTTGARLDLVKAPIDASIGANDKLGEIVFRADEGNGVRTSMTISGHAAEPFTINNDTNDSVPGYLTLNFSPGEGSEQYIPEERFRFAYNGVTGSMPLRLVANTAIPGSIGSSIVTSNVDGDDRVLNTGEIDGYLIGLKRTNDATGEEVGIGFGVTTNTRNIGAAITHERTGGYSQGKLHFRTKNDASDGVPLDTAMTIDGSTQKIYSMYIANNQSGVSTNTLYPKVNTVTGELIAYTSDARVKKDAEDMVSNLETICQLMPKKFRGIEQGDDAEKSIGLIAQEVESIIPDLVTNKNLPEDAMRGVNYDLISMYIINALKEIKDRLEALENGN
jgi:hypothetical protein